MLCSSPMINGGILQFWHNFYLFSSSVGWAMVRSLIRTWKTIVGPSGRPLGSGTPLNEIHTRPLANASVYMVIFVRFLFASKSKNLQALSVTYMWRYFFLLCRWFLWVTMHVDFYITLKPWPTLEPWPRTTCTLSLFILIDSSLGADRTQS